MKLQTLQIRNFKGFIDSGEVAFGPGFNVIVGQNNSGKTALIEALKLSAATDQPYKQKGKTEEYELDPHSSFIVGEVFLRADFERAAQRTDGFWLPISAKDVAYADMLNNLTEIPMTIKYKGRKNTEVLESPVGPFNSESTEHRKVRFNTKDRRFSITGSQSKDTYAFADCYRDIEKHTIFALNSQRYNIGRYNGSATPELLPDASNLPCALNFYQGQKRLKLREVVGNLREIFPSIGDISITPIAGDGNVEILVWPYADCDNAQEATPLDKCGTGISQALAILVIAAHEDQRVIVIDEISSFLHPMAIKTLIRILKTQYAHHQYIISTHYTDVIAWSDPDKVIITQKVDNACTARNISIDDVRDFELLAGELGLSMADVFGSDRIIWVEGETEEQCFPMLMELLNLDIPKGVNFSRILGTGNLSLKNRNVALAFDLYTRVSRMASRLTRPCLFTMDRETMSDNDLLRLKALAGDNLFLLNRRCYENYLISPRAVSELLTALGEEAVTEAVAQDWLLAHGGDAEYDAARQWTNDLTTPDWLIRVDGAKLLADAFNALTHARHEYRKTTHSAQLTRTIHTHDDGHLNELYDFVRDIHARLDA